MESQLAQTTSHTPPYATSIWRPLTSSRNCSQPASPGAPIHQNGKRHTAWSFPNLARRHTPTPSPTTPSLSNHASENSLNPSSPSSSPRSPSPVGPHTPHRWGPRQKTQQSTSYSEQSPLSLGQSARRKQQTKPHYDRPSSPTTSRAPSTKSTQQHSVRLCNNDVCPST